MKASRVLALALLACMACSLALAADGSYHKKKASGGSKPHHPEHDKWQYPGEEGPEDADSSYPAKPVAPKAPEHMAKPVKPVAPKYRSYDNEEAKEEEEEQEEPSYSKEESEEDEKPDEAEKPEEEEDEHEAEEHVPEKEHKKPVKEEDEEEEEKHEEEEEHEKEYEAEEYESYDADKPTCGPKQFPKLPACVDPDTGVCTKAPGASKYYSGGKPGACNTTSTQWCKSVNSKWCCCYDYRPATYTCRAQAGVCDAAETCTGTGPDCPADEVAPAGTSCGTKSPKVCYKAPVCDGRGKSDKSCKTHKVRNGTPCRSEGQSYAGLYTEVSAESQASVASSGTLAEPEALKKHGMMHCQRCYQGHCTEFKYQWWAEVKEGKKKYKAAYGHEYEEGKQPSGYKPELACHKMHDGEAEEDEY